ncbi:MAG: PH domain-containing protein [Coriobacteriia bacterium]|nr:PH domain-containing protein [Coriobacteriia bacterium]
MADDLVWFRSKIDWWLRPLLFVAPLVSLAILSSGLACSSGEDVLVGAIGCVAVGVLYGLFVIPVRYGIGSEELVIRFGVFRVRVGLDRIERVSPTRNPLSSPALSIDRIAIRTGPGIFSSTMISPDDREVFLSMLANRAGLSRDGDELVRV